MRTPMRVLLSCFRGTACVRLLLSSPTITILPMKLLHRVRLLQGNSVLLVPHIQRPSCPRPNRRLPLLLAPGRGVRGEGTPGKHRGGHHRVGMRRRTVVRSLVHRAAFGTCIPQVRGGEARGYGQVGARAIEQGPGGEAPGGGHGRSLVEGRGGGGTRGRVGRVYGGAVQGDADWIGAARTVCPSGRRFYTGLVRPCLLLILSSRCTVLQHHVLGPTSTMQRGAADGPHGPIRTPIRTPMLPTVTHPRMVRRVPVHVTQPRAHVRGHGHEEGVPLTSVLFVYAMGGA